MLSIQPIFDILIHINLVNDLIGVLLKSSSKYHDFIMLSHKLNELNATWPDKEEAIVSIFNVMD